MKRVLVVGAGGFVGGFAVAEGLRLGYEVWAGVRASTSRKYLADERIRFLELDFDNPESLAPTLAAALPEGEKWDWIIYNLGATKALNFTLFNKINYNYLRDFTEALKKAGKEPEKLLYMSSLSVMGPGDEKGYTPIKATDIPVPNTKYGASKLKAEMWLATSGIPYIIFRATGIYGPRDKDYFLELKSLAAGFDFQVGFRRQMLTFIYVEDLTRAMYQALEKAPVGHTYIISEKRAYSQGEFRNLAKKALGKKVVVPVKLPMWMVKAVSAVAEKWGVMFMKPSTLNRDKYKIMKQRNWVADVSESERDFGFNPTVDLDEGLRRSVEWYRKEKWMK